MKSMLSKDSEKKDIGTVAAAAIHKRYSTNIDHNCLILLQTFSIVALQLVIVL